MQAHDSGETLYAENSDILQRQLEIFAHELAELYSREKRKTEELGETVMRLRAAYRGFARTLAIMVEQSYDENTGLHLDRTHRWATAIARRLGTSEIEELELGFLLHDVGKVSVPVEIIRKPGPLTEDEWRIIRTHPAAGAQLLSGIVPAQAIEVVRCHHERWDGGGYPRGIRNEEIPVGARIFSVVDVFDALTSDRAYRAALPFDEALEIVAADRGLAFDPEVVDAFLAFVEDVTSEPDGA